MLLLHKCFDILRSSDPSRTMLTVSRLFRCFHSRSAPPGLRVVVNFHPPGPLRTTGRPGLLTSSQEHVLLPADRYEARFSSYRGFTTSTSIRSDSIGQIESKHYQLVYTCKVSVLVSALFNQILKLFWLSIFLCYVSESYT